MTERESELREARRFGWYAAALLGVAVLQGVAQHWLLFALVLALALLASTGAVAFWASVREAEPWEEPDPPKRPSRLVLVLGMASTGIIALAAVLALVAGELLDAASWLLYGGVMAHMARHTLRLRRATAPAKVPTRSGPPEEWI